MATKGGARKYSPFELEFYEKVKDILNQQGALPSSDPRKQLACMKFLMNNGVKASEIVSLIHACLRDKWHRPRILDQGFVHLRFRLNEIRALVNPVEIPKDLGMPARKWEAATVNDL